MKKAVSFLLILALALALPVTALAAQSFSDVAPDYWAYQYIEYASANGVVNGMGNGEFQPEGLVTVAQFTAIMTRAFYAGEIGSSAGSGAWYTPNVDAANNHGLLNGLGTVDYDLNATRYQMAVILYNTMTDLGWEALSRADREAVLLTVGDADGIPEEYAVAVANVYSLGLITGMDAAGTFAGDSSMTRAQAATVYYRAAQMVNGGSGSEGPAGPEQTGLTAPEARLTVGSTTYSLGMTEAELLTAAGEPDDKLATFAGYTWYVYGADTYDDFFMAGVYGSKVAALCASGTGFSYMGYTAGATGLSSGKYNDCAYLYTDKNDSGILHAVYLTDSGSAVFRSEMSVSAAALEGESRAVFYLTNGFRRYHGLSILKWSDPAAVAAALHSQDMADQDYFDHTSLDGRTPWQRMTAQGIVYRYAAENIDAGYRSGLSAYNGWVNSAGHRANMLSASVAYLGVGFGYNAGSTYKFYATQDFYG